MLIERKGTSNQNTSSLGRWWTQCLHKTTSQDSALPWKLFRDKREVISSVIEAGVSHHPPSLHTHLCASWSPPPGLSSDVILFMQFVCKIAEEKLGKRSGPAGSLFFISASLICERTNTVGKGLCEQKIRKVCQGRRWIERGGAWFKGSDEASQKGHLQRTLSY